MALGGQAFMHISQATHFSSWNLTCLVEGSSSKALAGQTVMQAPQ
jgi:hypothetical protein